MDVISMGNRPFSISHGWTQLIIGGDWNATLECIDKRGGTRCKPTAYRTGIISMMEELDLIDHFRILWLDWI